MRILGIDSGKNGGLCYLNDDEIQIGTMPKTVMELADYMDELLKKGSFICFIEKVQGWVGDSEEQNKGKQFRIAKLLAHYEQLITILKLKRIPYIEVHPRTWQNHLRDLGVKKKSFKNPKNAYKAFAIEKYPMKLKQINLKTADAVCISWYARQICILNPSEINEKIQ